jgi:hypothetical protein
VEVVRIVVGYRLSLRAADFLHRGVLGKLIRCPPPPGSQGTRTEMSTPLSSFQEERQCKEGPATMVAMPESGMGGLGLDCRSMHRAPAEVAARYRHHALHVNRM